MRKKLTSKKALKQLKENVYELDEWQYDRLNIIEKDLYILECFRKIPKQDLKNFIDEQIRYEINLNSWLKSCNCDLEKEESTKHLIKIKEWLENDN
ncbi:MAG: hypothetical protein SOV25_01640 [Candidatus Onthovivens sp.]|nr:hypothetical protein [Candidatus Onthovivens sp.]